MKETKSFRDFGGSLQKCIDAGYVPTCEGDAYRSNGYGGVSLDTLIAVQAWEQDNRPALKRMAKRMEEQQTRRDMDEALTHMTDCGVIPLGDYRHYLEKGILPAPSWRKICIVLLEFGAIDSKQFELLID